MTEQRKGLSGLRAQADATLFDQWQVTPELRERVHRRIRLAEKGRPTGRRPGGWVWAGGVAAAALLVAVVGLNQPKQAEPVATKAPEAERQRPAEAPAQYQYQRMDMSPITVRGFEADKLVTLSPPVQFTGTSMADTTLTVGAADANGNVVNQGGAPIAGVQVQPGRKIVLNAEYQLKVQDAAATMQLLQDLTNASGGYMVNAGLTKGSDGSYQGAAQLRIPSGLYGGAVQRVRQLGEIRQERQWSQDVTEQYMDLEARIRIQQEYEVKLKELAGKANTFEDWMKLTQQINSTRAEIERMEGSLKLMANQVDYSTINVSLFQPAPEEASQPKPEPEKGLWAQMAWTFGESVRQLGQAGRGALVALAAIAPFAVAAALVLGALLVVMRLRRRRDQA